MRCCLAERGEEKCERNNPEGRAEGVGGGTKCLSRCSPAVHREDCAGAGIHPAAPGGPRATAEGTVVLGEPTPLELVYL